jgi:DNA mismatch repair ATPase MutS
MNKLAYPQSLLIVKNGVFYISFDKDAIIFENLLGFKVSLKNRFKLS